MADIFLEMTCHLVGSGHPNPPTTAFLITLSESYRFDLSVSSLTDRGLHDHTKLTGVLLIFPNIL